MCTSIPYDIISSVSSPAQMTIIVGYQSGMNRRMKVQAQDCRLILQGEKTFSLEGLSEEDMTHLRAQPFQMYAFDDQEERDLALNVDLSRVH